MITMHCDACPRVAGLDPALKQFGMVDIYGTPKLHKSPYEGPERLLDCLGFMQLSSGVFLWEEDTVGRLVEPIDTVSGVLVAIEGYSHASKYQSHQLGEIGGVLRLSMWEWEVPYVVVAPQTRAMYATGKGNLGKDAVLAEAIRRLGYEGNNHNEADAMWIRALVMAKLGHPLVELPKTHLRAVDSIKLPKGFQAKVG